MVDWNGVYPAVTTQMGRDGSLDIEATQRCIAGLIKAGMNGLIMLGTVGENCSLSADEKRAVLRAAKEAADGRVPVLSGVAEYTTALGEAYARECEEIGIDGLMVLPAMVYKSDGRETVAHYRRIARASSLPIMVYNNPVSYGVDITPEMFVDLADEKTIVAIKESSENIRRVTDIVNLLGDRFVLFAGVDDLVLESTLLGTVGWVAGLVNVLNLPLYVIAGGVSEAWDLFSPSLLEELERRSYIFAEGKTRVEKTRLDGAAGLLGAARLAFRH